MDVKVTLLIVGLDKRYPQKDVRHVKILLDEKTLQPPSKFLTIEEDTEIISEIISKNMKIDENWMYRYLAGFRKISQNECEITYVTSFTYLPDCNRLCKFYTISDLNDSPIKMDEYYARIINRNGTTGPFS